MHIVSVPKPFQPSYKSTYPAYSAGKNLEEVYYEYFIKHKDEICTDKVYLPVFWTSYYVTHNYGDNIHVLQDWLDTLDKSKSYFTVVQYACGIYLNDMQLDLSLFSAGGGGVNEKEGSMIMDHIDGMERWIFRGNTGTHSIPLVCSPLPVCTNAERDIFCSFMGRTDTHKCRGAMKRVIESYNSTTFNYAFCDSVGVTEYMSLLNRSIFTLAPRGCGYTSFRIYEAILCGSIPVYIWSKECILPFSDIVDWRQFCIILNEDDIHSLPSLLERTNVPEMQRRLHDAQHLFSIESTFQYMTSVLLDNINK